MRATTIYREIGSAADNILLHSPRHVAVGLGVGYETLPAIGWHHFFMMVGLDIGNDTAWSRCALWVHTTYWNFHPNFHWFSKPQTPLCASFVRLANTCRKGCARRLQKSLSVKDNSGEMAYEVEEVFPWKICTYLVISFVLDITKIRNSIQMIFSSASNFWQHCLFFRNNIQWEIDHWNQHRYGDKWVVSVANSVTAKKHTSWK